MPPRPVLPLGRQPRRSLGGAVTGPGKGGTEMGRRKDGTILVLLNERCTVVVVKEWGRGKASPCPVRRAMPRLLSETVRRAGGRLRHFARSGWGDERGGAGAQRVPASGGHASKAAVCPTAAARLRVTQRCGFSRGGGAQCRSDAPPCAAVTCG